MSEFFQLPSCSANHKNDEDKDSHAHTYAESENALLSRVDFAALLSGRLPMNAITCTVRAIEECFEGGAVSDEDLLSALSLEQHALTKFLLEVATTDREDSAMAAKSLAFAAHISPSFWADFVDADYTDHLQFILHAAHCLVRSVRRRMHTRAQERTQERETRGNERYDGFDVRDLADYNLQGYEDIYAKDASCEENEEVFQEEVRVLLLVCTQFFASPIEMVDVFVENDRDRAREANPIGVYDMSAVTLPVHLRGSGEGEDSGESDGWPLYRERYEEYEGVLPHLLTVAQHLLELTKDIFDDGFQQCIKALLAVHGQFSLLNQKTTEVVDLFIREEKRRSHGSVLSQAVILSLNENGYPNMSTEEAIAAAKFLFSILSHKDCEAVSCSAEQSATNEKSCHLYTNDLKVLVDIVLRELVNIPSDETNETLRVSYINLLEAIVRRSDWSTPGMEYKKNDMIDILQNAVLHDTHTCRILADELLFNLEGQ